jgi:hypothetical protein
VNNEKFMLYYEEEVELFSMKNSRAWITWHLIKSFDFFRAFMYLLDAYDEKNDDYLLIKAFKVFKIFYLSLSFKIIFKLS